MFKVVEKDVEEEKGFLHEEEFKSKEEAKEFRDTLREKLGTDYYDIFVVEVE